MTRSPKTQKPSGPTDPGRALEALRGATAAFAEAAADSEQTLRVALDLLIEVTGADAGAVAVPGGPDGLPRLLAQRSLEEAGPVSMTVLETALADGSARTEVSEPPASASVLDANITSVLCIPVRRQGRTLAAVYLDRRGKAQFDEVARAMAESFAAMLALALDLTRKVEQTEERAEEARAAAAHAQGFWRFGELLTHSRAFAACLQLAERIAASDSTVLIQGETGVGKEHLARCVHAASTRNSGPFLVVNCAAIPEGLLESELFGHERGAFTGAVEHRRGKFELAHGGTLLLDEIGEMPRVLQPKLLRVLDARRIARLGGSEEKAVDVRILAATNRDLAAEVGAGRFREDLLYRLNVVTLTIPPLRERPEDVPELARAFLELEGRRTGRELRWDEAALRRLPRHVWPGNVRELRNVVEKLALLAEGPVLRARDVETHAFASAPPAAAGEGPPRRGGLRRRVEDAEAEIQRLAEAVAKLQAAPPAGAPASASAPMPLPAGAGFREQMDEAARQAIARALEQAGSLGAAASLLGLSRQGLWLQCKRLGLKKAFQREAPSAGQRKGERPERSDGTRADSGTQVMSKE
jgi:transcriptional regulator with GAF, ATPase, and Fis domain